MANVSPEDHGIPNVSIYMGEGSKAGKKLKHGPRVKVDSLTGAFAESSVTVGESPRVVRGRLPTDVQKQIFQWIELNLDVLRRLWAEEIGQREAQNLVTSLEQQHPITFFHPSLHATKRAIVPGEPLTDKRAQANSIALAQAIEAGDDVYYVHEVTGVVMDDAARVAGLPNQWTARVRLEVLTTKSFTVPANEKRPPSPKRC
jgi:hypothetical protein